MSGTPESALEPSDKAFGLAELVLDRGIKTQAIGHLYGLDFEIADKGFSVKVFFDRYSRRLKVVRYEATDYGALTRRLSFLAEANDFDKIFLKATARDWERFVEHGFVHEGTIKYFFRGDDAYVMSKFFSDERADAPQLVAEEGIIEKLHKKPPDYSPPPLPEGYQLVVADRSHIPEMAALYRAIFPTYPTPLSHPDYIDQTMQRHVVYRVVLGPEGDVQSAASAEIDEANSNAELTDCATSKKARGKALMFHLLGRLEEDLRERGIMTGYTLARATSIGMNRVFYRLGYEYTGRLINNCDISGAFEDMNIWVKRVAEAVE